MTNKRAGLLSTLVLFAQCLAPVQAIGLGGASARKYLDLAEIGLDPGTVVQENGVYQAMRQASAAASEAAPETIEPEFVELPLNHFAGYGEEAGSYKNRFWVAKAAYKPGGPVFLYDAGEADAEPNALFRLQNETSFFKQIVDKYNGIGIVWEHRFYGKSTPVPIDLNTPWESFEFLTTEQSLADVDVFAKQFKRDDVKEDLTPKSTPWVFVGGSYPGMRAAFMRKFYPETIYASYASSAPTEAKTDMSVYFEPVYRGLNAYGWGNCTKDIHAAVMYMDEQMENEEAAAALKQKFLGPGAEKNTNAVFADALSVIFWLWQSYGVEGGVYGLRNFCDHIETDTETKEVAGADGFAASRGPEFAVDQWAKWPQFTEWVNENLYSECAGPGATNSSAVCNLDLQFQDPSMISWTWQYCTQWGYFQSANLGESQLLSKYNSQEHQRDICHRQFPAAKEPLFPDWPRTDETNKHFGGWYIRPSNVYWSGGEFDPWRTLSPQSSEPGAPHPQLTTEAPECNVETDVSQIFGYVLPGAQHCYDFRTTFAGGAVSREYFTTALSKWLKCFKPGGYGKW